MSKILEYGVKGGLLVFGTIVFTETISMLVIINTSFVNKIRANLIDTEVVTHFGTKCSTHFRSMTKDVYLSTTLDQEEATVTLYRRWKNDGTWDACMRGEDDRV
jgi:hypothetical protein